MTTTDSADDNAKTSDGIPQRKPLVFISHKHSDASIAKALGSWLQIATGDRVRIFQSSDGFRDGPGFGRSLTEEIRSAAHDAEVMLVVYTDPEDDWEWVMFEIGIALDPTTPEAKVVLIQCGSEEPRVLRGRNKVALSELDSCIRFVKDLLTTPFFDGQPSFTDFESTYVKTVADQFVGQLRPLLPQSVSNATWSPHLNLQIRVEHTDGEAPDGQLVRTKGRITSDENNQVARDIYGVVSVVDASIADLINKLPETESLVQQMLSAMTGEIASSAAITEIKGQRENYLTILSRVRRRPFQHATIYDFHLVPTRLVVTERGVS